MELAVGEELLRQAGYHRPSGLRQLETLAADGSSRRFYRCFFASGPSRLLVLPAGDQPAELAEAAAAAAIGRHLFQAGVPVPQILGFAAANGALVMEDLGSTLLYDRLQQRPDSATIIALYRQAIEGLLTLQVTARPGFSTDFCWDTPRYDCRLMRERESAYFQRALVEEELGLGPLPAELAGEFTALARRAGEEPADYVLHRDYQCRNLMLCRDRLRIIDFQGARLGPLGYDLASLLYDPYAALVPEVRETLLSFYLERAESLIAGFDRQAFCRGWYYLALQRNLQILGAFAFLSGQRGKLFFRRFLRPAAAQLTRLLAEPAGEPFPCLRSLAWQVEAALAGEPYNQTIS